MVVRLSGGGGWMRGNLKQCEYVSGTVREHMLLGITTSCRLEEYVHGVSISHRKHMSATAVCGLC